MLRMYRLHRGTDVRMVGMCRVTIAQARNIQQAQLIRMVADLSLLICCVPPRPTADLSVRLVSPKTENP